MNFIPYSPEHFALIHRWHSDTELSGKIGYENPPTIEETSAIIQGWLNDSSKIVFLIEHNNRIIGYVTLSEVNYKFETATLHTTIGEKEFIGQKVCVDVIDKILDYAFNTLNLHRVTTYVMGNNLKLIETAKKYGWTEEGILKDYIKLNNQRIDCYIFRMLKTELLKTEFKKER